MSKTWKVGDRFFRPVGDLTKIWRVHRVSKRGVVWYLANCYGTTPPRGIIRKASLEEADGWVRVKPRGTT